MAAWRGAAWIVRQVVILPLETRIKALEKGQEKQDQSLRSLHEKFDDLAVSILSDRQLDVLHRRKDGRSAQTPDDLEKAA